MAIDYDFYQVNMPLHFSLWPLCLQISLVFGKEASHSPMPIFSVELTVVSTSHQGENMLFKVTLRSQMQRLSVAN